MLPCTLRALLPLHEHVLRDPATLAVTAITALGTAGGSYLSSRNAAKASKRAANQQTNDIRQRQEQANAEQRDALRRGRGRRGSGDFNVLGRVLGGGDDLAPLRRLTGAN